MFRDSGARLSSDLMMSWVLSCSPASSMQFILLMMMKMSISSTLASRPLLHLSGSDQSYVTMPDAHLITHKQFAKYFSHSTIFYLFTGCQWLLGAIFFSHFSTQSQTFNITNKIHYFSLTWRFDWTFLLWIGLFDNHLTVCYVSVISVGLSWWRDMLSCGAPRENCWVLTLYHCSHTGDHRNYDQSDQWTQSVGAHC